jgi:hypothetical protein
MSKTLDYVIRRLIDWYTRIRSPFVYMIASGISLVGLVLLGVSFSFIVPTQNGPFSFSFDSGSAIPPLVVWWLLIVATILMICGIIGVFLNLNRTSRKRVIAIEVRGLRDWNGPSLKEGLPTHLVGQRELVLIDLRQKVNDGVIVDPEVAMSKILEIRSQIETREQGRDRSDLLYVYGGLAPVPLTFLAGICLDDESPITVLDWDRETRGWRELDELDDGLRFKISGLQKDSDFNSRVTVAISASYKVDVAGALQRSGATELIHLELEGATTSSNWSEEKQSKLGSQFLEVIKHLQDHGVREVDLFLAGPNSLVLRFGMAYDKRNLPAVTVYQFDSSATPPFTWGIRMPVAGQQKPSLISQ